MKFSRADIRNSANRLKQWPGLHPYLFLAAVTISCLAPFSGRAFHIDDTMYLWAAQQISRHPLDPYGFDVSWDAPRQRMADINQNPPLISYAIALLASVLGWSERALHCGFMLFPVALVLGTYRLAKNFTRKPLFAALVTLLTPGVIVGACGLMCDTMMLALWMWAAVFWIEGLKERRNHYFAIAGALAAGAALAKYFGLALIPLLLVYSIIRLRRAEMYLLWLLLPVAAFLAYLAWVDDLYGHNLLFQAAAYAKLRRTAMGGSLLGKAIIGLSFTGGCSLLGLTFAPLVWARKPLALGLLAGGLAGLAAQTGWIDMGAQRMAGALRPFPFLTGSELILCVSAGISVLALAGAEAWKKKDADTLFLALWLLGSFCFAAFVNYTVNSRSILPLIPAAGILLARHIEARTDLETRLARYTMSALVVSGIFSLWVAAGDAALANSARTAATLTYEKTRGDGGNLWFEGHWGLQYYMESLGARRVDYDHPPVHPGDFVVIPSNNTQHDDMVFPFIASEENFLVPLNTWITTVSPECGAGFYHAYWGLLPYAICPVPPEKYTIIRLSKPR